MNLIKKFWMAFLKAPPILVFILILILSINWGHWIYGLIWGYTPYDVSPETFWENIWDRSKSVPFEELIWRFIPFIIAIFVVKWKKNAWTIAMMAMMIVAVQVNFGISHIPKDPILRILKEMSETPTIGEYLKFVLYQGGLGLFYAMMYLKILLQTKSNCLSLFYSILLHILVNQSMVILGLLGI